MPISFELIVSRTVSLPDVARLVGEALPGVTVVVGAGIEEFPERFDVGVVAYDTQDPHWRSRLDFVAFPDDSPLGADPDLRLAECLSAQLGLHALCDPAGRVPGLDPSDPFWFVARIDGRWYLADAVGTRLLGPGLDTDGATSTRGDQPVRLLRELELSGPTPRSPDAGA